MSRLFRRVLLCAIGLVGIVAGGPVLAAPGVAIIGSEGLIPPLDPHRMTGTVGLRVIDALYDPLIREDLSRATTAAPDLKPALAESWTASADGKTYRFALRRGVVFHDGTVFDAAAVQANFARIMDKAVAIYDARAAGNMTFLTRWIESTAAVDSSTFEIRMKEAFSGFPRLLSDRRVAIVSPAALDAAKGDALGQKPVGTGPFTLSAFQQGQPLTLMRFDRYWGDAPKVQRLIFRPITDPTAMAIAMQAGQVDVIPSASAQQVAQLKSDPNLEVQYPEPANSYFVRFNTRPATTANVKLRQALNFAINRDNIAALFDGQAIPAFGPVPAGNEIPTSAITGGYGHDPARARRLIAESGLPGPIVVKLLAPNSGPGFGLAAQVIALLQQDLRAVGVQLDVQFLEFSALIATEGPGYKDDVHGSFNGWTTGAESAYFLERMFSGAQQPPSGVNRGWYRNDGVDRLFGEARVETDDAKRLDLYVRAGSEIANDAPWLFLYQDRLPRVVSRKLSGVVPARSVFIDYTRLVAR